MDGLLGWRATWLAALGAGLSGIQQFASLVAAMEAARGGDGFRPEAFVVRALTAIATIAWCGYFIALYRAERGLQALAAFQRITILTLLFVFGIRTFLLGVEAMSSMFFDVAGVLTVAVAGLSIVLWILVLGMLGFGRLRKHVELIVTPLITITVLQSVGTIGGLLRIPPSLVSVATFFYAATQLLFLIAVKSHTEGMTPGSRRTENR